MWWVSLNTLLSDLALFKRVEQLCRYAILSIFWNHVKKLWNKEFIRKYISIDKPNDSVIAIGNETANNLTVIIFEGRCQKGNLFGPIIT